jgi:type II secretory pathway pseudopilin PulG
MLAIVIILLAIAVLSVYSNVQKARRDTIEKVTITPAAAATAQPSASPAPAGP